MNIHPAIVHFPIALLTIYTLMELVWSKKLRSSKTWLWVKTSFLIIGVIGSFAALSSGEEAEDQYTGSKDMVKVHEEFAEATSRLFVILGVVYAIELINVYKPKVFDKDKTTKKIWKFISKIQRFVFHSPIIYLFALTGLVLITITGALGGGLTYGTDVDPIVSFVYSFV